MDSAFRAALERDDRRGAAEWLVRHHAGEVHSLCRALIRNEARAEELAQDVFVRAFGALDGFRGEASSRTWILAIARNRCLDELRRGSVSPIEDDPEAADASLDDRPLPPELCENRAEVLRALHVLPELARALVVLRFVHGFDYAELGRTFGIQAGTARMRVSRALARMRSELVPQAFGGAEALQAEEAEALPRGVPMPQSAAIPSRSSAPAPMPPSPKAPGAPRARRRASRPGLRQALSGSSRALTARLLGIARGL